jgi:hypothetical protein
MKKSKNYLIIVMLVAVISACTVSPTFSWLSEKSETVVNTFAGGTIAVVLDETQVDAHGKFIANGARVTSNNYKYVAGNELDKDPTVTVLKGSDPCYVFICIENELNDLFSLNIDEDSWLLVAESEGKTLYVYNTTIDASESTEDIMLNPIFTKVTVSEDLTESDVEELGEKTLCATAYAIQTDSIDKDTAFYLATAQFMPDGTTPDYNIEIS